MRIIIDIETDNAAFEENEEELEYLLLSVVSKINAGYKSGSLRDTNGNRVGDFKVEEDA